jgi:hypothetical protein
MTEGRFKTEEIVNNHIEGYEYPHIYMMFPLKYIRVVPPYTIVDAANHKEQDTTIHYTG